MEPLALVHHTIPRKNSLNEKDLEVLAAESSSSAEQKNSCKRIKLAVSSSRNPSYFCQ